MRINVEAEIRDLKRRVGAIERSLESPRRHVSALHKDLLAFQARTEQWFDRTLGRSGQVSGRFDAIDSALDEIECGLRALRADMPRIIRRAVLDALGPNPGKKP
jgi:hypothetical protein